MPRTVPASAPDLLAAILDHLPLGVWVGRAPTGEVLYANHAFRSILGMGAVEGVGIDAAPATYRIHDQAGNLYPVEKLPFSRVLATGAPAVVDDIVIDRGAGGQVNVRAFGAPVRDAAGAIDYVIVAFIDITAEVRAVADRKRAEDQRRFAVHHAPVALWASDRDGIITLSEGAALAGLGVASDELVGRSVLELYAGQPAILETHRRVLAGEEVHQVTPVGSVVFEACIKPLRDERGAITGLIGMATDVTERRRLEARIIQNDRVAAMGTLAASVAHEINNPLTYVLGSLSDGQSDLARAVRLLAASARSDPRVHEAQEVLGGVEALIAEARTGADRIGRIARDLHSFARPADETERPVALDAVIQSVLQLVRKEIAVRAQLVVDLAETPSVRGNEPRLVQVVLNLLVNAWQALPEGHPERHEVAIRTRHEGERVVIEVSDSGPGIPPENRERIFDPFFTTKEAGAGTGLGLFVCRSIVQGFGGDIAVHDRPGGGALFRVALPAATAAAAASASTPAEAAGGEGRRPRVLIIDDDERVARVLMQSLKDEFEVRVVLDGSEALELLLADPGIDLVYCDLMMKGCDGMQLHDIVSDRAPDRVGKLVFMTGGAFTARATAFVERLADAVVYKPFDILAETRRRLARGPA